MKTPSILAILSLLALSTTGLHASDQVQKAIFGELPVAQIGAKVNVNGDKVVPGTSRIHVRLRLGAPTWVLADGSWVYSNYVARTSTADPGQAASLVVRFVANRVNDLTMIDHPTLVSLREMPASGAGQGQFVAAAKASR